MPRPKSPNPLGHIVSVLFTKTQFRYVRKVAALEGRSYSSYVRRCVVQDLIARGVGDEEKLADPPRLVREYDDDDEDDE